jgi:hypothetical protein
MMQSDVDQIARYPAARTGVAMYALELALGNVQ